MFELPTDLPPPVEPPAYVVNYCVKQASEKHKIHPYVLEAIIAVEGGKVGTVSKNSNNTYDLGLMQINTVNLPQIQKKFPKVGWTQLAYSPCINIAVATWMLSNHLKETKEIWKAVGNYHSRTPKYHNRYLKLIDKAYRKILEKNKR